jgi:hypothetical protein
LKKMAIFQRLHSMGTSNKVIPRLIYWAYLLIWPLLLLNSRVG